MNNREKWIRILGEEYFSPSVYRDEPILRTAASMKNYMPEKYREMHRIAHPNGLHSLTPEEIFYRQAKFMENFEDDFDYGGDFFRYFPTYQSMSDLQLRGYFSWRTHVRRGELPKTSLSFVFIYLYELINGIGYQTPEEGYAIFKSFSDAYSEIDVRIRRYTQLWLRDYVIYHGLDLSLLSDSFDLDMERSIGVFSEYTHVSDDVLFSALCACSSYKLEHSRFYRENETDVREIACRAYRAYAEYYVKNRKYSLFESLFGKPTTTTYLMFSSAIFCPQEKHPDAEIVIGPYTSFSCRNGKWTHTKLWRVNDSKRQIGSFLRAVDMEMRKAVNYPHALKSTPAPKYLHKIIAECILETQEEKRKQAARVVKIDVSKLSGIRAAADVTRDKLIVEEEPDDVLPVSVAPQPTTAPEQEIPFGLNETEACVLRTLLCGGDPQSVLQGTGQLLSVVADSINEKCFDTFSDTVLVFDADMPCVLEDYADELKGYLL